MSAKFFLTLRLLGIMIQRKTNLNGGNEDDKRTGKFSN
jgi:hypothetical protein